MNVIDPEKRRTIMQRSIKLGHCICNPKLPCPCPMFREKDVCQCAGERPEQAVEEVKLTSLVEKAGCASKINQNDLKKVLSGLPTIEHPDVLVGTNTCDDAGVYKLTEDMALVQTVDVFSPSVDDPYTFGQIAATNSLSDVYAMGGRPLTALSVIGFPIETLSPRIMTQMLRGGMDKMQEAGVAIIGGHSINDKEPKFGYAVTGTVDPSKMITNDKARPGDVLVLTKPLGVGVISFANQMGMASKSAVDAASQSMTELNKTASEVMVEFGVEAATDVTGFGLAGHMGEMTAQSKVTAELYCDRLPVFDEVLDYIRSGVISGGVERNREHSSQRVIVEEGVPEDIEHLLYDPQTSGGMLIAVPQEKAAVLVDALRKRGISQACIIGKVVSSSEQGCIILKKSSSNNTFEIVTKVKTEDETVEDISSGACCCGEGTHGGNGSVPDIAAGEFAATAKKRFSAFMGAVYMDGAIPAKTKELLAIALSVLSKCEPCVKIHIDEAREMGVSDEEINEAVWMAISFGGAPTMMFYRTIMGDI